MKSYTVKMTVTAAVAFSIIILFLLTPSLSLKGAVDGLLLCGNVIIPSLFPFCVVAIFMFKSGIINFVSRYIDVISRKIFHLSGEQFCVFIMSFLAGYPVGMRLICELADDNKITSQQAKRMGLYCINAGPAFILVAVGEGILYNRDLGVILLFGNIIATIILAVLVEFRHKPSDMIYTKKDVYLSDAFVESTAQSAASVFSICAWVVLFSSLLSILKFEFLPNYFHRFLSYISEVTTAVISADRNMPVIAAIISFGGLSVHCQIYSVGKKYSPSYLKFLLCRIFHALISAGSTFALLKLTNKTVDTFSNGIKPLRHNLSFTYAGAVALFFLCVFFIISTQVEKDKKIL